MVYTNNYLKTPINFPMRHLFFLVLLLNANVSSACVCAHIGALTKAVVDKTSYVALIRITEILPFKVDSPKYRGDIYFKIIVEEITHFKGPNQKELIVSGGNKKFNTWTSCDFGMAENDEWVIFGEIQKGQAYVHPCTRTARYRAASGYRDLRFKSGINELDFLNAVFNKQTDKPSTKNGKVNHYFPNGRVEKKERYRNGKLHGEVQYFYPNGVLQARELFYKGKQHKASLWYYHDGSLETKTKYDKGLRVDTFIYYSKTRNSSQPYLVSVYNKKGELTLSREYGGEDSKRFLSRETVYQPALKKETTTFFYPDGKVRSVGHRTYGYDSDEYIEYDELGNVKRRTVYGEEGRTIKQ
jgi:antitoxin component YwqK of YwqJK toxin-antitoxin module